LLLLWPLSRDRFSTQTRTFENFENGVGNDFVNGSFLGRELCPCAVILPDLAGFVKYAWGAAWGRQKTRRLNRGFAQTKHPLPGKPKNDRARR
jgi:hypothetical protein